MRKEAKRNLAKQIVHWLLLAVTMLLLVTGFGITQFRIVETLTFGLLSKTLAFKIHSYLWIPLLVLLMSHIYLKTRNAH